MDLVSRRTFVQMAGGTVAASTMLSQTARADVNSSIRVAILGVNGRGENQMKAIQSLEGAEVALLCDPDEKVLALRAGEMKRRFNQQVESETDMRRVFDRDDIDAVVIATPNHWHALATIWACQAGKDVYVEKPGSHNIFEGRKMIEAAHKYNRVVQHGVQLRSSPALQEAVQHLRDGLIGDVYMARGLVYRWRPSIGKKPNEPAPDYLHWDLWQGPAQERDFSRRLVHYNWHWHWDYGNGDVGNQGIHETDMCLWGLGVELPSKITAMGGKFLCDDDKETPELLTSSYFYPDQNKMIEFEVRPWCTNHETEQGVGNIFYGSKGYMVVHKYGKYETFLGRGQEPGPSRDTGAPLRDHLRNFFATMRSRNVAQLNGPVETAHTSSGLAHLGNISYRLGRQLDFDPETEKFVNDSEADAMLTREYRAPYVVPEEV